MHKQATRNLIRGARSAAGLGPVATTTWIAFEEIHANALNAGLVWQIPASISARDEEPAFRTLLVICQDFVRTAGLICLQ
jgi:hypothetical protein